MRQAARMRSEGKSDSMTEKAARKTKESPLETADSAGEWVICFFDSGLVSGHLPD